MNSHDIKIRLRLEKRRQRRGLGKYQQNQSARQLQRQLEKLPVVRRARYIGLYLANDGEIDPWRYFMAHRKDKACFVPKTGPNQSMLFTRLTPDMGCFRNHYGIREITHEKIFPIRCLDVVFVPLVAFDSSGNRLGMGGGFYDRAFSFKKLGIWHRKPFLIGLAHDFQQVDFLPADSWDIPLQMVVTNVGATYC